MKNYLLLKYLIALLKEYIFIFLTATIFLFISFEKSFGEENVFTINEVKVKNQKAKSGTTTVQKSRKVSKESGRPAGTYYYASRFRLNGSDFSYGGIDADNMGNFWDDIPNGTGQTYNNGTLTVTDPPPADVVITEIMYNSAGIDDEWIEICNVSGSTQVLNNYTIN